MSDESPKTPDPADMPTQDNAAGRPQATGYTMSAGEILDRYHIAQAVLNGAPIMVVLGQVISAMVKGAAGAEGQDLGRQLSIVTANFVNLAKQKRPSIIVPGNAPGVPNGLGGKRH